MFRLSACWVRSAMFCLLQVTAAASSGSPGSDTRVWLFSARREATLVCNSPAGVRPVAPTTAAQLWDGALATGGFPTSWKTSCLPLNVAVSGRLNWVWSGVVKPHGYALISSEWASTSSVNGVELDVVSVSPN